MQQPVRTGGRCSSGGHILDDSCDTIHYQSDPTRAYDEYSRISRWNGARAAACVPPHCWCMHVRAGRPCIERRAVAFGGGFRTTGHVRHDHARRSRSGAGTGALSRALRSRVHGRRRLGRARPLATWRSRCLIIIGGSMHAPPSSVRRCVRPRTPQPDPWTDLPCRPLPLCCPV
jgi:hypothetical protein